ncbi:MAG: hypothetical protein ACI8U4_001650, partial [Natronomonas sp.]
MPISVRRRNVGREESNGLSDFYFLSFVELLEFEVAVTGFEGPLDLVFTALFPLLLTFPFAASFRIRHCMCGYTMHTYMRNASGGSCTRGEKTAAVGGLDRRFAGQFVAVVRFLEIG